METWATGVGVAEREEQLEAAHVSCAKKVVSRIRERLPNQESLQRCRDKSVSTFLRFWNLLLDSLFWIQDELFLMV